ncbi:hypothetical protein QOZ80_7BG0583110 [Eleusine coracana subsp. coracana]|nr:hypothetical protein QOZ80_7BG0583110 [Eleusine coracana subsp. coracana]
MAGADRVLFRAFIWVVVAVAFFPGQASALWDETWRPGLAVYPVGSAIAVDLGNTNSCVAGYLRGESETMFHTCIPSWVAVSDDGTILVGEDAVNHAAVNPDAAITGFKRLFGKRLTHKEGGFVDRVMEKMPYKVMEKDMRPHMEVKTNDDGGSVTTTRQVSVDDMSIAVLAKLKATAEAYLDGRKVRHAVFTLPEQFRSDAAREAVKFTAAMAGLSPMRILDEPIAAATAYNLHRKLRDEGNVLVLHIGGGTAEATIMMFADGVFDFLGGDLDPYLGGQDFDQRIVDHFVQLIKDKYGKDIISIDDNDGGSSAALRKLRTACEDAKKALSSQEQVQVKIESLFDGVDLSETLTRAKFEELSHDLFQKLVRMIDTVMSDAEVDKGMVDEVVLIGGSTMIPKVRKIVRDYFGGKELNTKLKPDEAVTYGAALLSHPTANGYPCMGVDNRYQIGAGSDACYV